MKRRTFIKGLAQAAAVVSIPALSAAPVTPNKRLGIGMHSYGAHWSAARGPQSKSPFHDPLTFLEYAHSIGAGGVQVGIGVRNADYTRKLRERTETLGAYLEGQTSLPRDEADVTRFENEVRATKDSGAMIIRTAMLGGRRYETFNSVAAFKEFAARSWKSLTLAEPVLKKHGIRLAIENHKDWLITEMLDMLRRISSEYVGVCVDIGNSIALLENAMAVVEAYAPFAVSTHVKDMGVAEDADGFLLSEVSLGEGYLDLRAMIATLQRANAKIQFNLEMITRDPLKVPCLTPNFWATFAARRASELARFLGEIRAHAAKQPLPRMTGLNAEEKLRAEDDNVRKCIAYARRELSL